jgi:hypothetical protein
MRFVLVSTWRKFAGAPASYIVMRVAIEQASGAKYRSMMSSVG